MTAPVEVRNRVLNARFNMNMVTLSNAKFKSGGFDNTAKSWFWDLVCVDTTRDPADPYVKLETDCNGLAGVTVVAAARCVGLYTELYQSRSLMLAAFDSSDNLLGTANYGQPPNNGSCLLTLEWTVPAGTSKLEYRLYTAVGDSTDVWWSIPILCTKTDWQALQGVGVTYFNQDTLPE